MAVSRVRSLIIDAWDPLSYEPRSSWRPKVGLGTCPGMLECAGFRRRTVVGWAAHTVLAAYDTSQAAALLDEGAEQRPVSGHSPTSSSTHPRSGSRRNAA
jgi:hypothetical protein